MDLTMGLIVFFGALLILFLVVWIRVAKDEKQNEEQNNLFSMEGSNNKKMETDRYRGKYQMCSKLGVINE